MTSISNLYLGMGLIYSTEWGKFPWSVRLTVNRYCTDKFIADYSNTEVNSVNIWR